MTTHVGVWLGPTQEGMDKLGKITKWLSERNFTSANSMTDLVWGKNKYFSRLTQNKTNPFSYTVSESCPPDKINADFYLHVYFKSAEDALLFKLTWGGQ